MKIKKALYVLILLIIWIAAPLQASAENADASDEIKSFSDNRNIYAGDIITLKITAQGLNDEALREKFRDFEITMLEKINGEYLLSLRTFEPGEYKVLVGDKEIIIYVSSTLDDINREDIFEGGTGIIEASKAFYQHIYFYIAAGIFILSSGFILLKSIMKRRIKELSIYQVFLKHTSELKADDDNFLVDLTFCFKEYLNGLLNCQIIGKTSSEIISGLKGYKEAYKEIDAVLPAIEEWLKECDKQKFMSEAVSIEGKQRLYKELVELVENIDASSKLKMEGAG